MTKYKGYIGQFTVDTETGLIRGEVINTRDVITFHGRTVPEADQAFRDSVDDYIDFCRGLGEEPEKPYSGKLLLRLSPELHQELDILAKSKGKSINKLVAGCLARMAHRYRKNYASSVWWEKTSKQETSTKTRQKAPARKV